MNTYNKIRKIFEMLYANPDLSDVDKLEWYKKYISGIRKLAYKGNADAQYDLAQHYEDIGFFGIPNPILIHINDFTGTIRQLKIIMQLHITI